MVKYNKIISKFNKINILVIGDIILDRYIQGTVSRISPEAPVPIVLEEKFFDTPGGAANVSHNLCSLGAKVTQVGKVGYDFEGGRLKRELKKKGIDISGIFVSRNVPTVTKTRVIAQHQQVVRIDKERISNFSKSKEEKELNSKIIKYIAKEIDNFNAIIISDYGKGIVTSELVKEVCAMSIEKNKIITVDPKEENFDFYEGVTAITPNKKEAENAIRNIKILGKKPLNLQTDKFNTDLEINKVGCELLKFLKINSLLLTLGEQGMRLFEGGKKPYNIKTRAREVFDVSGAGDTVISVFTLALAAGSTKKQAAELANFAAGVVVGKLGAVAITKEELLSEVKQTS